MDRLFILQLCQHVLLLTLANRVSPTRLILNVSGAQRQIVAQMEWTVSDKIGWLRVVTNFLSITASTVVSRYLLHLEPRLHQLNQAHLRSCRPSTLFQVLHYFHSVLTQ